MYLHNILQKNPSEMIRKIYETQKINPSPGNFSELVKDDMLSIGMNISEEEISKLKNDRDNMTKERDNMWTSLDKEKEKTKLYKDSFILRVGYKAVKI